jgi:hypothetical protein
MELSRRRFLMQALFGSAGLGLKALASGIPISILANPRAALAQARNGIPARHTGFGPQYVVLATSGDGDPLNANAPGSYISPLVGHPTDPSMAATALRLKGNSTTAALPWSQLAQPLLDRSCFFHHGTYTVIHSDEASILALGADSTNGTMLASLLAGQLGPALHTVQNDPVVLGPRSTSEDLVYDGHPEPILAPSSLAAVLAPPSGPLGKLTSLRDAAVDELNALVKAEGHPGKSSFIDAYALSQTQARNLSHDLLSNLASITDDSPNSQVTAAVTLIRMNVAPLVSIHIPFGADNHTDANLFMETTQTVSGVATIGNLWSQLVSAGLQDSVCFLSLNVFGRTLLASTSERGRQHNGNHHVAVMFGAPFQGSVIGGIETAGNDLGAMSISSATGAGVPGGGGDIAFSDTLRAMATTFGTGIGVDPKFLAKNISGGKTVSAALAPG